MRRRGEGWGGIRDCEALRLSKDFLKGGSRGGPLFFVGYFLKNKKSFIFEV
jgi:hypothetical protein